MLFGLSSGPVVVTFAVLTTAPAPGYAMKRTGTVMFTSEIPPGSPNWLCNVPSAESTLHVKLVLPALPVHVPCVAVGVPVNTMSAGRLSVISV